MQVQQSKDNSLEASFNYRGSATPVGDLRQKEVARMGHGDLCGYERGLVGFVGLRLDGVV
jgi:hypothetical protein